ncbi:hypothetical protein FA95DRAFT_1681147 [Auriscalpium vulgare]|uniref:Uncharacterized protein n=1 Tax=Auriscalpium vulgare TaxID=40419 RepID=A0ACB8RL23_9AGAM|nr:hypothetical protein FA95DRAFT_1681147 [Auriscalpium vulgare]
MSVQSRIFVANEDIQVAASLQADRQIVLTVSPAHAPLPAPFDRPEDAYNFEWAWMDARTVAGNPRNLEVHWYPVFGTLLRACVCRILGCMVIQQPIVWSISVDPNPDNLPLDKTLHLPQRQLSSVEPDLTVALRLPPPGPGVIGTAMHPLLGEWKRAIPRGLTHLGGVPRGYRAINLLGQKLSLAKAQVEAQACELFAQQTFWPEDRRQSQVILLAGAGGWFTAAVMDRDTYEGTDMRAVRLGFRPMDTDDVEEAGAVPDDLDVQPVRHDKLFEGFLWLPTLCGDDAWSKPVLLGTADALEMILWIKRCLHSFATTDPHIIV